jgi:hypothetical protein
MRTTILLPSSWVNALALDYSLASQSFVHGCSAFDIELVFPVGCKIMVDAGTRLLSLVNQAAHCSKRIRVNFEEGASGTMGYLDRMGFFDYLDSNISVLPSRPTTNFFTNHRQHRALVEFARILPSVKDDNLPGQLAQRVARGGNLMSEERAKKLEYAAWHVFAELIQNIHRHAEAAIDGYAAMQIYNNPRRGRRAIVSVSDSGKGMFTTLRAALANRDARIAALTDADLLLKMVTEGVSRFGAENGCGICSSAQKALAFDAQLDFRLYDSGLTLIPTAGQFALAQHRVQQSPIWGTHIAFDFRLDTGA